MTTTGDHGDDEQPPHTTIPGERGRKPGSNRLTTRGRRALAQHREPVHIHLFFASRTAASSPRAPSSPHYTPSPPPRRSASPHFLNLHLHLRDLLLFLAAARRRVRRSHVEQTAVLACGTWRKKLRADRRKVRADTVRLGAPTARYPQQVQHTCNVLWTQMCGRSERRTTWANGTTELGPHSTQAHNMTVAKQFRTNELPTWSVRRCEEQTQSRSGAQ
jgi:predicted dehydrogenase